MPFSLNSIRTRFYASFFVLLLIIIGSSFWLNYIQLNKELTTGFQQLSVSMVTPFHAAITKELPGNLKEIKALQLYLRVGGAVKASVLFPKLLEEYQDLHQISFVDSRGKVLGSASKGERPQNKELLKKFVQNRSLVTINDSDRSITFIPFYFENNFLGGSVTFLSKNKIITGKTRLLKASLLQFVFFFVLGFAGIWWLSNSLLKPIAKLADTSQKISKEADYSIRVEEQGSDEISTLSRCFNNMLEQIQTRETERAQAEEELRGVEEQLRQSQKMEAIGTLAGGIAHDFNNILSAILGYTELTLRSQHCDAKGKQNLNYVLAAAGRARELIKQILLFSRKKELNREPMDLHNVVLEASELLRKTIPSTIPIRMDICPNTGIVRADSTQIHQIVMNLCTNAYHSLPEQGGEISIKLNPVNIDAGTAAKYSNLRQGRYGQLTISDTGSGMSPEIISRIFDPFFTTKKTGQGTGMGLAVTHGIIQSHDGAIGVESSPGKGTTFKVFFPLSFEHPKQENATSGNAMNPRGKEHILLVDDEAILVELGKETLEALGYKVTATTSAIKALKLFEAEPAHYDLIITDQTMPEMAGDVLTKKALQIRSNMPVLICTGHSATLNTEKTIAIGAKALLMKPLSSTELSQSVRKVFDG